MKARPPVVAELTWPQVHAFRLQRHHLFRRAPKKSMPRVAGDIGGAQAQLMSAAELQLVTRADCGVTDVRNALWKDKSLVKTWLMRGTLHLIPADDLPVYTAATRSRWVKASNASLKYIGLTRAELEKLTEKIGGALTGQPMTREEILNQAGRGQPDSVRQWLKSGWGGMLKPVARQGLLCFGPNRGQSVTFVRPQEWLPTWREVDPDIALVEVARRYLRAYGPATKSDFARWWGNWPGVGNAAWSGLASELVSVSVEGARADILERDLGTINSARIENSVQLLPAFDPYLMGYANRDHLFDAVHRSKVSRTAGWISACVLHDGRVVGTWTFTVANKALKVTVEPFRRLPSSVMAEVRNRAASLAGALELTKSSAVSATSS